MFKKQKAVLCEVRSQSTYQSAFFCEYSFLSQRKYLVSRMIENIVYLVRVTICALSGWAKIGLKLGKMGKNWGIFQDEWRKDVIAYCKSLYIFDSG